MAKKKTTGSTPAAREPSPGLAEAIAELPEELVPIYESLHELFDGLTQSYLLGYYRAGVIVRDIRDTLTPTQKSYSVRYQMAHLAKALGINSRILYNARRLVEQYSEEEYSTLIARQPINWAHVQHLLAVADTKKRQQLVDRVVAEHWSAEQLEREISGTTEKLPRGPGRAPALPRTLTQGLQRTVDMSKTLCNTMDQALFGDRYDIPHEIEDLAPDELTASTREKVAEAVETLTVLAKTASDSGRRLQGSLTYIDEVLVARDATDRTTPTEPPAEQPSRRHGRPIPSNPRGRHDVDN